jgi:hypothetical protein
MTERAVIRSMVEGILEGPQTYAGVWFAPLTISVVGVRWNSDAGYYEFRDPAEWLGDRMQARVIGLPLIGGAIDGSLNSFEFNKRALGTIVASYVKDNTLMAIVRVCNDHALRIILSGAFDTRIAAVFDDEAASVDVGGGRMCVEPPPRFLSHLSLVPEGAVEFEFGFTLVNPEAKAA